MKFEEVVELSAKLCQQALSGMAVERFVQNLDELREKEAVYVALAYSLCQVSGEESALRLGACVPHRRRWVKLLPVQRRTLMRLDIALEEFFQNFVGVQMKEVSSPESAPDHLVAVVMQQIGGEVFESHLQSVLSARSMPPDAFRFPPSGEPVYSWAVANGLMEPPSSIEVKRLLEMKDGDFVAEVLKEAEGRRTLSAHPAIADRRLALERRVDQELQKRIKRAEEEVQRQPLERRRDFKVFRGVMAAYKERGRFLVGQRMAKLEMARLRIELLRLFQSRSFVWKRVSCLQEAARTMAEHNPELWETVTTEVEAHQKRCPKASRPFPCAQCGPQVAASVRARFGPRVIRGAITLSSENPSSPPTTPTADGLRSDEQLRTDEQLVATEEEPLVVVVEMQFSRESNMAGLAWVAKDGRVGAALEQAGSKKEATRQAIRRAWFDLRSSERSLAIICRNASVARQAQEVLRAQEGGALTIPPGLPADLVGHGDRVAVIHKKSSEQRSQHDRSAVKIAARALAVARGESSREELKAYAETTSKQLGGTGEVFLTLPESEVLEAAAAKEIAAFEETAGSRLLGPEDEIGAAQITRTSGGDRTWQQVLRAEHLRLGRCPLPAKVWDLVSTLHEGRYVPVVIQHGVQLTRGKRLIRELRAELGEGYLSLLREREGWPGYFFPGMIVDCTWSLDQSRLTVSPRPLPKPLEINGRVIAYEYNIHAFIRDVAPGGWLGQARRKLTVEQWVLRTLQVLGYLDPHGRALLTEDALQRNMIELGFPREKLGLVEGVVKGLINRGELRYVQGSLDPNGRPAFPARPWRPAIRLLCYEPCVECFLQQGGQTEEPARVRRSAHEVAPFIRRLPEGKSASRKAREGYAEAVRRAELVGDDELPPGYTFVPRHSRGR